MEAATLRCPACGAVASLDSTTCNYCHAPLATAACARCFARIFVGAKHCSHCGAATREAPIVDGKPRACPRCSISMTVRRVGESSLGECGQCGGVWVDSETFEAICADNERQAPFVGTATGQPPREVAIRYVPCPECHQLMNRLNFGRISGVIVDRCQAHGLWFDRDELGRVVDFIRRGGLVKAHARELEQVKEERRRVPFDKQLAAHEALVGPESGHLGADLIA